jgi:hypothetical protein
VVAIAGGQANDGKSDFAGVSSSGEEFVARLEALLLLLGGECGEPGAPRIENGS